MTKTKPFPQSFTLDATHPESRVCLGYDAINGNEATAGGWND